ncbi:ribosome biogenesis GTP-binding protein YihA/YsxC [Desulfoplanes formicivorans]|uniref:Probable GTP-binding protein EngB n=1 Tax=Desulfoplanes formicivorans TaxID=1592317 RepID=A0A194AKM9_9BACT|nr:ribosome biogenesis GTP-binding protein YihA/YsxC [Desulfoplanes formicivorans]GAU09795.1 GTP-binding protein [Desulfoplanes formicivorans]
MPQLTLESTIYTMDQLSVMPKPQVAMAGRSNVGKSSLINCLAGRRKLAKISSSPGKTRSLNFYGVSPGEFYLVDLPGYGYARCSKKEREKWRLLIAAYMEANSYLKAVVALFDCRLTPQMLDIELARYVTAMGVGLIPVLTKADKCKQRDRAKIQKQWQELLDLAKPPMCVSSKTGMNRDRLWTLLGAAAGVHFEVEAMK